MLFIMSHEDFDSQFLCIFRDTKLLLAVQVVALLVSIYLLV